jgi:hypothetical protein
MLRFGEATSRRDRTSIYIMSGALNTSDFTDRDHFAEPPVAM